MFESISSAIKKFGALNGLIYLVNQGLVNLTRGSIRMYKFYLYLQPISENPLIAKKRLERYSIKELTHESVDPAIFCRPLDVIKNRYDQGGQCIGCYKNDELLGYIWFTYDDYIEDVVRCTYKPLPADSTCWDFDIYIKPKYRLGFVFAALWESLNTKLIKDGYIASMSRISAFAVDSIRSHENLGAKRIGVLYFIKILKFQIMIASRKPYIAFSTKDNNAPIITINSK